MIRSDQTVAGQIILAPTGGLTPIGSGSVLSFTGTAGMAGIADWSAACSNQLQDIANATAYFSMYDAYKINSISVNIEYLNNMASVNGSGVMPTMYLYWDQDDVNTPPTLGSILGKQGVRKVQFGDKARLQYTYTYKPTVSVAERIVPTPADPTVVTANTRVMKAGWINCQQPNVTHFGFKVFCTDFLAPGTTVSNAFRFNWTYNVSFRSPLKTT